MNPFPQPLRNTWNNLDIRVFVLCSLLLQILLIFFGSLRKRGPSKLLILFTWSLYLLADWVAVFTLGLIANSQSDLSDFANGQDKKMAASGASKHTLGEAENTNLMAFWAPVLLLHLGGPDAITAFAMEDNELWFRHLLGVVFQVSLACYIFLLSLPINRLIAPTLLMFVAGIIKYGERTYALYQASMKGFRNSMLKEPNPGPDYAKMTEEYQSIIDAGHEVQLGVTVEPLHQHRYLDDSVVELDDFHAAYAAQGLFKTFKGLLVDLTFSHYECRNTQDFFSKRSPKDAFRVIEFELEFLYEMLFTKAIIIHSAVGYILRTISSCSIMAASLLFYFTRKLDFAPLDVAISYMLLVGAIILDFLAFVMLLLSDWTIVKANSNYVLQRQGRTQSGLDSNQAVLNLLGLFYRMRKIIGVPPHNRWSESISQYNLIDFCIPDDPKLLGRIANRSSLCGKISEAFYIQKVFNLLRWEMVNSFLDEVQHTSHENVTEELKTFIFEQIKRKMGMIGNNTVLQCRGRWALEQRGCLSDFVKSIDIDFDESLLRWHIATTLCYYTEENASSNQDGMSAITLESIPQYELSKYISDYMMYLLIMQPSMMSSTAVMGQDRFRDTCAEAKNFFLQRPLPVRTDVKLTASLFSFSEVAAKVMRLDKLKKACSKLLSVNTILVPRQVKGDRCQSVLFDGCILAKDLKTKLELERRWAVIGEVWVEMLSYAAVKCNGIAHAQRLSKGGELLTFVWYLICHLGLGEQYRIRQGYATNTISASP